MNQFRLLNKYFYRCCKLVTFSILTTMFLASCMRIPIHDDILPSNAYFKHPELDFGIKPIQTVDEFIVGWDVLSFTIIDASIQKKIEEYKKSPNYYVTNLSNVPSTLNLPYLGFLMTFPITRVGFDVYEVQKYE